MDKLQKTPRSVEIRHFILDHLGEQGASIGALTATAFDISRQAVNRHLRELIEAKLVVASGTTRNRRYRLARLHEAVLTYTISADLSEDVVWVNDVCPLLGDLPENVMALWHHGFTEMFNNAIDHSGGTRIDVLVTTTAAHAEIVVIDDGVGIFRKIQAALGLLDERHAVLELAKGKLTTDPARHSGEGIFFTSRMFDTFDILSGGVHFSHAFNWDDDYITELEDAQGGTMVGMSLKHRATRTPAEVFDRFTSQDGDFVFNKTVVPVHLARYGDANLISRSQAKRLLARIELFKDVVLDFDQVNTIGQAFADEIFRVFARAHPEINFTVVRANAEVERMIQRARAAAAPKG